jgi:glycosidase
VSRSDDRPWWQTAVVYQVYPRSFRDTTGSGIGDLQGIIEKLEYLTGVLGVDTVWLSPFYPSPMADFGYDVSDYCDVHPMFGTLDDFDRLLARAHTLGLRIVVDFVPSHTSDRHPWFAESRASRTSPRRDWYVWRDPKPDGAPPNNWLSVFGGSAWEPDERTGQYYRHSFLREQPDLNWRHPPLRAALLDVMRFWLDRGVDGFRVDAVQFMLKDPAERDNPPNPDGEGRAHKPLGAYDSQLHVYDLAHPDIHQVFRDMRAVTDAYDPPRMTLGEVHVYDPVELGTYYGAALDGLSMPTNFGLFRTPWTAAGVRAVVDGLEAGLPSGAWPNYSLGNHDDRRLATRLGEAGSRQAAVLLLTLRGTPILYYGDEIGMREAAVPPSRRQDPWGIAAPELSRDGCRTPMPWSAAPGAGFTSAADPWLPLGDDWKTRNVESQLGEPDSLLNLHRRLLALRRETPPLRAGSYRPLDAVPDDCFVFSRIRARQRVLVGINFSSEPRPVSLPGFTGRVAVSTHRAAEGSAVGRAITLRPHEAAVLVE